MRSFVLLVALAAGCGAPAGSGVFESGIPGSSGHVEKLAPPSALSLEFAAARTERNGDRYDAIATFPAELVEPFQITGVTLDGNPAPYFNVNNGEVNARLMRANGRDDLVIHLWSGWVPNRTYTVRVLGDVETSALVVSGKAPSERSEAAGLSCLMPNAESPTYRLRTVVPGEEVPEGRIETIATNGVECRDFTLRQGEREIHRFPPNPDAPFEGEAMSTTAGADLSVTCRHDWRWGQEVELTVTWSDGEAWSTSGRAGNAGGWWDESWKHYAGVLLEESEGLDRVGEPVHVTLGVFSDRITDPAREVRVVTYSPQDPRADRRGFVVVPSQVHGVRRFDDANLLDSVEMDEATGERVLRYSATTTFDVAFLADVAAYRRVPYLVFYGNANTPAPSFETDLRVNGEGLGLTVENRFWTFTHAENSGAWFTIDVKQGIDARLEHKLETNGAIQWNPDCYSPPHAWVHASDWEQSAQEVVVGPVFCMIRRWAPLPHLDDVLSSSTNVYYAGQPYCVVTETTELRGEHFNKAVRQQEVVFNHAVLNEFVWKDSRDAVRSIDIATSRPHPEHVVDLPLDTDWLAFVNRERGVGFAGITLDTFDGNLTGGLPRLAESYTYVANGPWIYWSRALVYSFGSNNPSRMLHVPAGAVYASRVAYLPTRLDDGPDPFRVIETYRRKLANPLHARIFHDTDPRTTKGWVVPILTEPFDEGVEGAVGGEEENR